MTMIPVAMAEREGPRSRGIVIRVSGYLLAQGTNPSPGRLDLQRGSRQLSFDMIRRGDRRIPANLPDEGPHSRGTLGGLEPSPVSLPPERSVEDHLLINELVEQGHRRPSIDGLPRHAGGRLHIRLNVRNMNLVITHSNHDAGVHGAAGRAQWDRERRGEEGPSIHRRSIAGQENVEFGMWIVETPARVRVRKR